MKIAVSGKGGTGKTTLAGVMARILSDKGVKVVAIDADPDANLASVIGIDEARMKDVTPLARMKELIEERTGAKKDSYGTFFTLNPRVDDIPEKFSIQKNNIKLIVLGTIPQGGGGCFCPENALLRSLLSHVLIERDEYIIVDMEAGLEHMGRGTTAYMDAMIVVVEPGQRSFQTAYQVRRLAGDIGIARVYIVGNKVRDESDRAMIQEHLQDFPILGYMSYNEKVMEADKKGVSPYDIDSLVRQEVDTILTTLEHALI